jgi:hypothetical protein
MKKLIAVGFLFTAVLACKNEKKETKFDTKTYEQVKETLADKEKNNPARFLSINCRHRGNLIGQTVVIGTITNNATVSWYKDVELHLSFYSKTAVKLDEGMETVYEEIAPGKTVKFKTKYFSPKGTDSVSVTVSKAVGEIKGVSK